MPSTFVAQIKQEKDSFDTDIDRETSIIDANDVNTKTTASFIDDISSNVKLFGHMKTSLGSKIKSESRKLIGHPGRATLKRPSQCVDDEEQCISNDNKDIETNAGFSAFFKEHDILMEFKYVCQCPPGGIFVVPSMKSLQVWHGIIFVRAGPFKEGIFRFDILLPDSFPHNIPLVRFTSHIYHPQVHQNGLLNLEPGFPFWKKGEHHILDVLKYVKSCFFNLNTWKALNAEAVVCINENMEEFKRRAHLCVTESVVRFNEETGVTSDDDGNLLKARALDRLVIDDWKKLVLNQETE